MIDLRMYYEITWGMMTGMALQKIGDLSTTGPARLLTLQQHTSAHVNGL